MLLHSLAQAKTGTGKTLAFLVPVMQNILKDLESTGSKRRPTARDTRALIISPTRELAEQIAVEAEKVARGTGIVVQTAVGGTQKREKLRNIQRQGCHLLVGTPGRLKDILSDKFTGIEVPQLTTFVLDEADRLLDEGFAPEIEEISDFLPDRTKVDRQTLMFSATVPREVMSMVRRNMKPSFRIVKTVREDEVPTHLKVPQKAVLLNGLENSLPAVYEIAKNAVQSQPEQPFKAIVYFNSNCEVSLAYESFFQLRKLLRYHRSENPLDRMDFSELNSRLTQGRRTYNANKFRQMKSGILFSSDVTARGMDFPNVTHVIQVGVPRDTPSYIHRLGRTGRANKSGEGWLLLHQLEMNTYRSKLGNLPIERADQALKTANIDMTAEGIQEDPETPEVIRIMRQGMTQVPNTMKLDAYKSQLGSAAASFSSKQGMLEALSDLSVHGYGLETPPELSPLLLSKLGLDKPRGMGSGRPRSFGDRGFDRSSRRQGGRDFDRGGRGFSRDYDRGNRGSGFGRSRDDFDRKPRTFNRNSDGFGSKPNRDSFDYDNLLRKGIV